MIQLLRCEPVVWHTMMKASQLEDGWARICHKATANTQRTSEVSEVWLLNGHNQMPWEVHESDEENYVN